MLLLFWKDWELRAALEKQFAFMNSFCKCCNLKCYTLNILLGVVLSFFKILFEREHKQGEWQAEGEGEAGSPLNREPDVGLDPRTPGS